MLTATITDTIRTAPAGAIKFNGDVILFVWLCGCGNRGKLPLRDKTKRHPSWLWDGNRERPTLTPSVHCVLHGDPTTDSMSIRPAIPRTSDHPFQHHPTGMI